MDSLLRRLLPAHAVAVDGVVTVLIAVAGPGSSELAVMPGVPDWAAVVIAAFGVLPAAWRRRWPRAVLAVTAVGWAVATALTPSPAPALAVAFVMYLIPLRFPRRDALGMLAATLLVLTAGLAVFAVSGHGIYRPGGASEAGGLLAENGLLVVVAWLIGHSVRQRRAYSGQLRRADRARRGTPRAGVDRGDQPRRAARDAGVARRPAGRSWPARVG